jgi:hypothetical protein
MLFAGKHGWHNDQDSSKLEASGCVEGLYGLWKPYIILMAYPAKSLLCVLPDYLPFAICSDKYTCVRNPSQETEALSSWIRYKSTNDTYLPPCILP